MPIYTYEVILEDEDEPGMRFEYFQNMSDPPLTHHPITKQPVKRIISAPHIAGQYSDAAMKAEVSNDKKLAQLGLTKYVKKGDGYYEKTTGKGPDTLHSPD